MLSLASRKNRSFRGWIEEFKYLWFLIKVLVIICSAFASDFCFSLPLFASVIWADKLKIICYACLAHGFISTFPFSCCFSCLLLRHCFYNQFNLQCLEGLCFTWDVGHLVLQLRLLLDHWGNIYIRSTLVSGLKYYTFTSSFLWCLMLGPSGSYFLSDSQRNILNLNFFLPSVIQYDTG